MNGQRITYNEQLRHLDDYITKYHVYEKQPSLPFDLHGYAAFLQNNHIAPENVTPDMQQPFIKTEVKTAY